MTATNFDKEVLSINEVVEYLSTSKATIMRLVKSNVLIPRKLEGVKRTYFFKKDILEAMKGKSDLINQEISKEKESIAKSNK